MSRKADDANDMTWTSLANDVLLRFKDIETGFRPSECPDVDPTGTCPGFTTGRTITFYLLVPAGSSPAIRWWLDDSEPQNAVDPDTMPDVVNTPTGDHDAYSVVMLDVSCDHFPATLRWEARWSRGPLAVGAYTGDLQLAPCLAGMGGWQRDTFGRWQRPDARRLSPEPSDPT